MTLILLVRHVFSIRVFMHACMLVWEWVSVGSLNLNFYISLCCNKHLSQRLYTNTCTYIACKRFLIYRPCAKQILKRHWCNRWYSSYGIFWCISGMQMWSTVPGYLFVCCLFCMCFWFKVFPDFLAWSPGYFYSFD